MADESTAVVVAPSGSDPEPSVPAPESQETASDVTETPPTEAGPQDGAQDQVDWDKLKAIPPEELLEKVPGLNGKIGRLAQQQAQRAIQEERARLRQEQEQAQREAEAQRRLEERDRKAIEAPDELAEDWLKEREAAKAQQAQNAYRERFRDEMATRLAADYDAVLEDPEIAALFEAAADDEERFTLHWRGNETTTEWVKRLAKSLAKDQAKREIETVKGQVEELAKARLAALMKERNLQGADLEMPSGLDSMPSDGGVPSYTEIINWPFEKRQKFREEHKDMYDQAAQRFAARGR